MSLTEKIDTDRQTPTLRLRVNVFHAECIARGILTDNAKAAVIGLTRSQVHRATSGRPVGEKLIAGVLSAFGGRRFDDFFELVP